MNIVIIGMRGAGKSNISRRLSVMTKRPVLETDLLISYENKGRAITDIMEENGGDWHAFREMEYQVTQKVAALDGVIIDCGGGMVVDLDEQGEEIYSARKMALLKQNGTVVWLKGDIRRLAAKTAGDASRPNLSAVRGAEEIMQRRLPFYQQASDWTVDIECQTRRELAKSIRDRLHYGHS